MAAGITLDLCICPVQSVSSSSWWNCWKIWATPLDTPRPLTLFFAFLIVFWVADFWLLIYFSASQCCPGGCKQWVRSSISHNSGIKKQSSTSQQCTLVFGLEQFASEFDYLPPPPPVTSSLLSISPLLSKIFSFFVFPEPFIMQARGSISLLERELSI